jgi:hypothetical protein
VADGRHRRVLGRRELAQKNQRTTPAITAWPPAALKCTVEHADGTTTVGTYVPWREWIAVAIAALGVAVFTRRRALLSLALVVAGVVLWFF